MVANPFEFDLLARKAADFLGVSEALLRREARNGRAGNQSRPRSVAPAPSRTTSAATTGDAVAQAEIGLIAIALNYPELRAEIAAQVAPELGLIAKVERLTVARGATPAEAANAKATADRLRSSHVKSIEFHDPMLAAMLEDICLSDEPKASLEVRIMVGLSEEQRERLSALMVGPMIADADNARAMATEFIAALARNRHRREQETLRRVVADTSGDDAAAAFEALVALRRQTNDGQ
jgi:hypothetical protein